MTETTPMFRREGATAFPIVAEKEPSAAPSAVETEPVVEAPAATAPATEPAVETKVPFHEDKGVQEYIGRQVETRTKEAIENLRKEFGQQRDQNASQEKIPSWFGGSQEQWNEYRVWNDEQLKTAETRAIEGVLKTSTEKTETEAKAVQEATDYLNTEVAAITADKELNPSGKPIDANALFKIVFDNQLVDTKGRWNYRAGARIMNSHPNASHAPKPVETQEEKDKKALAGATVDRGGSGTSQGPKDFKTSNDFKTKRPW